MCSILKRLIIILWTSVMVSSCINKQFDECGMYLEFIFDYNMEYADAFNTQVSTVDVYIFDQDGVFLFHKYANTTDLINNKKMYLNEEFHTGTYQIITIGGMSEHFRFTDIDNNNLAGGVTTIEQVKLYLHRMTNHISHEFSHLWFAGATTLHYKSNKSTFPVHLIRNTNKFHVVLQGNNKAEQNRQSYTTAPYTFEIVTPEGAVYGHNNNRLSNETITYHPFYLQPDDEPENGSVGKLNTMRLFEGVTEDYILRLRDTETSEEVWKFDLMDLLKKTKPHTRPDGTTLPIQEYLDRQGEWNIVILHRGGEPGSGEAFLALSIKINGWIVWLNDIEI